MVLFASYIVKSELRDNICLLLLNTVSFGSLYEESHFLLDNVLSAAQICIHQYLCWEF